MRGSCFMASSYLSDLSREFPSQYLVERRRVRLALRRLHHLADEEAVELVLAGAILGDLVLIGRQHGVDRRLDGAGIGELRQAALGDDLARSLAALDHGGEYLLGEAAGNRAVGDEVDHLAQSFRRDRR